MWRNAPSAWQNRIEIVCEANLMVWSLGKFAPHGGTIYGMFTTRVAVNGTKPFIIFADRRTSWVDAHRAVDTLATILAQKGVAKGSRVAILSPNSDWYAFTIIALAKLGAACVPVNPELGDSEVAHIVGHAQVDGVIVAQSELERARAITASISASAWCEPMPAEPVQAWMAGAEQAVGMPQPSVGGPDDIWLILYTSGTTGFPKGVMHKQRTFTLLGECFMQRLGLNASDRVFCVLSLFHANAIFNSFAPTLAAGCTWALEQRFSASSFWKRAAEVGATEANIIAAIGNILIRRPTEEFDPHHRISRIYAVPVDEVMAETFRTRFYVSRMVEGYGLSEAPGVISNTVDDFKVGSLGHPSQHSGLTESYVSIRLVDDAGHDVPLGEVGEIIVRSAITMVGYFNDEEKTREAFLDGWFRTGDLGRQGDDGRYYFVSRKKDIIRRRGENVSAAEVERVIRSHPDVIDVAVIGVASDLGEEELWAVVRPVAEAKVEEGDIASWCAAHLASFKVPRYVSFLNMLPYTPSHRVSKGKLKEDSALFAQAKDIMARVLST